MTNNDDTNNDPQNAPKSAPKWLDKWKVLGRTKLGKDGRTVYVLEQEINGKRYTKTLPGHVKTEDDALAELALFRRDPDAYWLHV